MWRGFGRVGVDDQCISALGVVEAAAAVEDVVETAAVDAAEDCDRARAGGGGGGHVLEVCPLISK